VSSVAATPQWGDPANGGGDSGPWRRAHALAALPLLLTAPGALLPPLNDELVAAARGMWIELRAGASPEGVSVLSAVAEALRLAAAGGDELSRLLDARATVDGETVDCCTVAVAVAATLEHTVACDAAMACLDVLLPYSDVSRRRREQNLACVHAAHTAVDHGCTATLRVLASHECGRSWLRGTGRDGATALHVAASATAGPVAACAVLDVLLPLFGADVDAGDGNKLTAATVAGLSGNADALECLLLAGACVIDTWSHPAQSGAVTVAPAPSLALTSRKPVGRGVTRVPVSPLHHLAATGRGPMVARLLALHAE